jgi:hypothetical protein
LWLPSFFCQDVVRSLLAPGFPEIALYEDAPWTPSPDFARVAWRDGDACLVANLLGLRGANPPQPAGVEVVEDHTHDPWSDWAFHSRAHFAFASLRKTLPIPDGAPLWSPRGVTLPPAPPSVAVHEAAAHKRAVAAWLKDCYLEGAEVGKATFRALAVEGETELATTEPVASSRLGGEMLRLLPVKGWRTTRWQNFERLRNALLSRPGLRILGPHDERACPFGATLELGSRQARDALRQRLVSYGVYPALLWDLDRPAVEAVPAAQRELASRLLFLHCDARYGSDDIDRLVRVLSYQGGTAC